VLTLLLGEQDAELLKNITKQDICSFFLARIIPSSPTRSKLSVHLHSQKAQPRISAAAADAFEALLGRPTISSVWKEENANREPVISEFVAYWKAQDIEPDILAAIPELVEKYPCAALKEGVTQIEDVGAFKKSLEISEEAQPLVEWEDSPLSKY
jgi:insulysin